jgi:hypothetical protein
MKLAVGIDPGESGAIVAIDVETGAVRLYVKFKGKTTMDILMSVDAALRVGGEPFALIERVSSMPGQGVASTFAFGRHFGKLEMALAATSLPFDYVQPAKWQREFGLIKKKGETNTQKKNRHKAVAQQLFPEEKVIHATADALLIAEYCRRTVK